MLVGEPAACPPHAALDLVDDQQDAVLITNFAQPLQEACGRGYITTLSQHRLDQYSSGLVGRGLGL